ncbi:hypothetical protein [Flammeovirga pacifica]|uniref:Uncharacterized protein n=1 Tax=Flammeovirga pacifica TaxID=915059 RepID=A0A1S1Z092_FLAPC|nr:hypothetical protein [Flammeovirga pacifica]OHX66671.1 hypothetical protein NH26_10020 [Flammeovirga pacifica]
MEQSLKQTQNRIINSPTFITSFRAKKLLKYLLEHMEEGKEEDFSSYVIALEVFDREEDFDPSIDPIVRVQMGRLRALLSKYYLNDSVPSDVIIEIPKGKYQPRVNTIEQPSKSNVSTLEFPSIYFYPTIKGTASGEQLLKSISLKLYHRFYINQFFKVTLDRQKADFQLKTLWENDILQLFLFDKNQTLVKVFECTCTHEEEVATTIQLYIDGYYSPFFMQQNWKGFKASKLEYIFQFDKEILENHRYEILSAGIQKLEESIQEKAHPFLIGLLIKLYHLDFHYGLNIYDHPIAKANQYLTKESTPNMLSERIWSEIYQRKETSAYQLYLDFMALPKHYEAYCQELFFHAYFGEKTRFNEAFDKMNQLEYPIPNSLFLSKAALSIVEGKSLSEEEEKALDEQPFSVSIFLLSIGSNNDMKRKKSNEVLLDLIDGDLDKLQKVILNWVNEDSCQILLEKYKSTTF